MGRPAAPAVLVPLLLIGLGLPLPLPCAFAEELPTCAQPVSTGANPLASDCLFILKTAVGQRTCTPACRCAPKGSLPVKASDALLCLRKATGQEVTLACPCVACAPDACDEAAQTCEQDVDSAASAGTAACPTATGQARTKCLSRVQTVEDAGVEVCQSFETACDSCCANFNPGCDAAPEVPLLIGDFELPERQALEDTQGLPPGPNGEGFLLLPLPDGEMGFDPFTRTPVTAAAECAGALLSCFRPDERNWAGCLAAVPVCGNKPWEGNGPACCATGCLERYEQFLRAGRAKPVAAMAAIYEAPSCMPGVDAFTNREVQP